MTEILPGQLYLGGLREAVREAEGRALGVTHVLCVAREVGDRSGCCGDGVVHRQLGFGDDDPRGDIRDILDDAVAWIHAALTDQGSARVLVHCWSGVSRAPLVVMAYLHRHRGLSAVDAVLALRPIVDPWPLYLRQFQLWAAGPPCASSSCGRRARQARSRSFFVTMTPPGLRRLRRGRGRLRLRGRAPAARLDVRHQVELEDQVRQQVREAVEEREDREEHAHRRVPADEPVRGPAQVRGRDGEQQHPEQQEHDRQDDAPGRPRAPVAAAVPPAAAAVPPAVPPAAAAVPPAPPTASAPPALAGAVVVGGWLLLRLLLLLRRGGRGRAVEELAPGRRAAALAADAADQSVPDQQVHATLH